MPTKTKPKEVLVKIIKAGKPFKGREGNNSWLQSKNALVKTNGKFKLKAIGIGQ